MADILFITTNRLKVTLATLICDSMDVKLTSQAFEMEEIQAADSLPVARHKAAQAYDKFQQPVVVSDDGWVIPGLGGFPGPYMKAVNEWFTPDDFLRLTLPLRDRRIILQQVLVYQDEHEQKLFSKEIEATLLKDVRGVSQYPHLSIISFDGGVHGAAEDNNHGYKSLFEQTTPWHELCDWLRSR